MKKLLPILAVSVLLIFAGCMVTPTSYSAPPAETNPETADKHGYSVSSVEEFSFNRTVSLNNQDYRVNATNWMTVYSKSEETQLGPSNISVESAALYAVVSTPSAEFAGQELNPIASAPTDEVISRVTDQNEEITVNEKISETAVNHNTTEQEITVEKYDAQFEMSQYNQKIDGYVLISVFNTSDAVIVTLGAYPDQMDEEAAIHGLIRDSTTTEEPPNESSTTNSLLPTSLN